MAQQLVLTACCCQSTVLKAASVLTARLYSAQLAQLAHAAWRAVGSLLGIRHVIPNCWLLLQCLCH